MGKHECHPWRLERYWNEECEKAILKNDDILKDVYKAYGKAVVIGKRVTLAMPGFISMITATELVDESFGAREIGTLYNLSMMT